MFHLSRQFKSALRAMLLTRRDWGPKLSGHRNLWQLIYSRSLSGYDLRVYLGLNTSRRDSGLG
jgi:hypothetical protein